jgi:hypothetical protein
MRREMPSWLWEALGLSGVVLGGKLAADHSWWWIALSMCLGGSAVAFLGTLMWALWQQWGVREGG